MKIKSFILLICLITGCSNNKTADKLVSESHKLMQTGTEIKFPADNETYPNSNCIFPYISKQGIRYLCYLNEKFNEIQFYYIDSLKLSYKLKLAKKGPDGVGKVNGFFAQSLDSVFITSKGRKTLFLVNRNGEILNKTNYYKTLTGDIVSGMTYYSTPNQPLIISENKYYITIYPEGNWNLIKKDKFLEIKICMEIDALNQTSKFHSMTYPENSYEKNDLRYGRICSKGIFVYNFYSDHNIYTTKNHIAIKKHQAKSKYFNKIEPIPKDISLQEYFRHYCETPSYERIMFDKYRSVYYRIAYPGIEVDKEDNLRKIVKYKPFFSIIILDKDFNKIGETLMPKSTFYLPEIFILKEGIYLSSNHIDNPEFNENFLSFSLFKLVRNEEN